MTFGGFCIATVRLAAIVGPAWVIGHVLRLRLLRGRGASAALAEIVLVLSVLLVGAELLGVVSLLRFAALVVLFAAGAAVAVIWDRARPGQRAPEERAREGGAEPGGRVRVDRRYAVVAVVVVAAQWCLGTANSLGAGMLNFDTLWYHMPFAAGFAETGSITGIHFTQADPYVAYYPANSELFHALGIIALRNDFLSPALNLMWLAIALLAAWRVGARWRVQPLTLIAGALILSLPVMSLTQAGEARNDVAGLAMLLAAIALVTDHEESGSKLAVAGLALGIAVGTKYTFVIPAAVIVAGMTLRAAPGGRARALGLLAAPLVLTGGYWYVRALVVVGNPVGLRMHLGPVTLPGPSSPLANSQQQTVASEIGHLSLWASRFAPALYHTLGPLFGLILIVYVAAVIGGLAVSRDPAVRILAIAAALAGLSYLFFPTGATQIAEHTNLFEANLRYAAPALMLGALLIPIVARVRAPRTLPTLGPALLIALFASQFETGLWPSQTARHVAFIAAIAALAISCWTARRLRGRRLTLAAVSLLALAAAGTFAVQRHYFDRRYLLGDADIPGLGAIYRWAQGVGHVRIAVYGSLAQYPLYGARDTNVVDYLGVRTGGGGYRPIATCSGWRSAIGAGGYQYVALTPAPSPSPSIPVAWTQQDPGLTQILHPASDAFVFKVTEAVRAPCD